MKPTYSDAGKLAWYEENDYEEKTLFPFFDANYDVQRRHDCIRRISSGNRNAHNKRHPLQRLFGRLQCWNRSEREW